MRSRFTRSAAATGIWVVILFFSSAALYSQVPAGPKGGQGTPVVFISRQGTLFVNEKMVEIDTLTNEIKRTFPSASTVYIRADRATPWASVSQVMAKLDSAKIGVRMATKAE
jgi:biopolymer transport protein ExbD